MVKLASNRYGKSRVRLVKVRREAGIHSVTEWNVQILVSGDFEDCFTVGDNSNILATDTMKNTVYSLARSSSSRTVEEFAQELVGFLLDRNPQIESVEVEIEAKPWDRLSPTAFRQTGPEVDTTTVTDSRAGVEVRSGIEGLVILKTARSGFVGFVRDDRTTLPETTDRLLGTEASVEWTYAGTDLPFADLRARIVERLLATFAAHDSLSVQHTLYAMGRSVLDEFPEVREIAIVMPNRHCLLVNLAPFGQDNPNEIFVPTDEPHGTIAATLVRE